MTNSSVPGRVHGGLGAMSQLTKSSNCGWAACEELVHVAQPSELRFAARGCEFVYTHEAVTCHHV